MGSGRERRAVEERQAVEERDWHSSWELHCHGSVSPRGWPRRGMAALWTPWLPVLPWLLEGNGEEEEEPVKQILSLVSEKFSLRGPRNKVLEMSCGLSGAKP